MELGYLSVFGGVLTELVQRVNADVEYITARVLDADGFHDLAVDFDLLEAAKATNAVVVVYDIVPGVERTQCLERQCRIFRKAPAQLVTVVALKDLMIGIKRAAQLTVDPSFRQALPNRLERDGALSVFKDGF